MTIKLFDNPWLYSAEANITEVKPAGDFFDIATDKTVFFPGGGGQEPDTGRINGQEVLTVYEENGTVFHRAAGSFAPGQTALLAVDPTKRRRDAEIHTGEHMLSGLASTLFGAKNVGFHMGAEFATADFAIPLTAEQVNLLELEVNTAIRENRKIEISYPGEAELDTLPLRKRPETDEPLRVVAIEGADMCACCGTHVLLSGEVGLLKIISAEKLRGGTRLGFVCGGDAFALYAEEHRALTQIAREFSAKPLAAGEHVKKQAEALASARREIAALETRLARLCAVELWNSAELSAGEKYICAETDLGPDALIPMAEALCAMGKCHVFIRAQGRYVLASSEDSDFDLKGQNEDLKKSGARGGGKGHLFSGRLG